MSKEESRQRMLFGQDACRADGNRSRAFAVTWRRSGCALEFSGLQQTTRHVCVKDIARVRKSKCGATVAIVRIRQTVPHGRPIPGLDKDGGIQQVKPPVHTEASTPVRVWQPVE